MTETWLAAFGILALLTVANTVLLVAVMRQVGVLHQRVPHTGPGSFGPEAGTVFERLEVVAVRGATVEVLGTEPVRVLAYVTPGCSLCERIPGFLTAYLETAPAAERAVVSLALATDAPDREAEEFREQHGTSLPFVRHPDLADHYALTEVGSPYLLALADRGDGHDLLLAGGIVNTLEQLEDLVEFALDRHSAYAPDDGRVLGELQAASGDGGVSDNGGSVTVIGGVRGDDR